MPYISQKKRESYLFRGILRDNTNLSTPDRLSFVVTQVIRAYLSDKDENWDNLSDVLKAIDAARESFMEDVYRPHERVKKKENGEVY